MEATSTENSKDGIEGWCHICRRITEIKYCQMCKHWFCDDCRGKITLRAIAALHEWKNGAIDGCCGPFGG